MESRINANQAACFCEEVTIFCDIGAFWFSSQIDLQVGVAVVICEHFLTCLPDAHLKKFQVHLLNFVRQLLTTTLDNWIRQFVMYMCRTCKSCTSVSMASTQQILCRREYRNNYSLKALLSAEHRNWPSSALSHAPLLCKCESNYNYELLFCEFAGGFWQLARRNSKLFWWCPGLL